MGGKNLLLGSLLIVLLFLSTEGRKRKGRKKFRGNMVKRENIMLADGPSLGELSISPGTKKGTCSCKCCVPPPPAPLSDPLCLNDIIVAVDSSACFRAHYPRMKEFVADLVEKIHESGSSTEFGLNKTRLGILQFSSKNVHPVNLDDFKNYSDPPSSNNLTDLIQEKIRKMRFLGEGSFLNKALNSTVLQFWAQPRPYKIIQQASEVKIRKVLIILTNGNSHPNVTQNDTDQSIEFLKVNNVTVLPVSVTSACYGTPSANWNVGLCPNLQIMRSLSQLNNYVDPDFLSMRASGTIRSIAEKATDCDNVNNVNVTSTPPCNNCTCDCELPIGPQGPPGIPGPKSDSIQGPKGEVGPKGNKGAIGGLGLPGVRGEKGVKGELGHIGEKGGIGPQGPKGNEGIEGSKGQQGEEGFIGTPGEKGDFGQKGDSGQQGEMGSKGDTGEQGFNGTKGDVGEKGVEGPKGQQGDDGESVKGDRGDVGPKGTKGMTGPNGPPGLKGMKGMQGLCGKPGPAGRPGEPGLPGLDGQDGVTGPPGIQGPRGPEGITGEKGQRGQPGIDGQRGGIGPEGRPGSSGPQGEPGQRGADGRDSDVPGSEGPLGPTGKRGDPGENGLDGIQGPQGEQGLRGLPGPKCENCSIDLIILRTIIVDIVIQLLPGECGIDTCVEHPIDLVFLIDGSDSISRDNFRAVLQWILKTVDRFKPMDRIVKLQLDVVQFSDDVENPIHALIQNSSEEVRKGVEEIIQMRSGTKIYTGLSFVNAQVSPHTRTGSSKILIIMTDGDASEKPVQSEINKTRNFYDIMIGVGIGSKVNITHLNPTFIVQQFSALEGIIDDIVRESCKIIREAPVCCDNRVYSACATFCPANCQQIDRVCISVCDTNNSCVCPHGTIERSPTDKTCIRPDECPIDFVPGPCNGVVCQNSGRCMPNPDRDGGYRCICVGGYTGWFCQNGLVIDYGEPTPPPDDIYYKCVGSRADIAFLIDGSTSVGDENFEILRRFLYNMVSSFENIEPDGYRVQIIQYNDSAKIELSFEDSTDQATVLNKINNLDYLTGNTQTGAALETAYEIFANIRDTGDRPGVAQVAVVITDGRSQDDVTEPALALQEHGVTLFAIGVTDSSEHQELADMASAPEDDHIYKIESYEEIENIKESLIRRICATVRGSYRVFDEDGNLLEDYIEGDLLTGADDAPDYSLYFDSGDEEY